MECGEAEANSKLTYMHRKSVSLRVTARRRRGSSVGCSRSRVEAGDGGPEAQHLRAYARECVRIVCEEEVGKCAIVGFLAGCVHARVYQRRLFWLHRRGTPRSVSTDGIATPLANRKGEWNAAWRRVDDAYCVHMSDSSLYLLVAP